MLCLYKIYLKRPWFSDFYICAVKNCTVSIPYYGDSKGKTDFTIC